MRFVHQVEAAYVTIDGLTMTTAEFLSFEPEYINPPTGVTVREYDASVPQIRDQYAGEQVITPGSWLEGDTYLSNKAYYQEELNNDALLDNRVEYNPDIVQCAWGIDEPVPGEQVLSLDATGDVNGTYTLYLYHPLAGEGASIDLLVAGQEASISPKYGTTETQVTFTPETSGLIDVQITGSNFADYGDDLALLTITHYACFESPELRITCSQQQQ